jgi:hypothetical protein
MLAFVGAGDDKRAARLERVVAERAVAAPTRYGATTRDIGPAGMPCAARVRARRDAPRSRWFASLPPLAPPRRQPGAARRARSDGQRAVDELR